MANGFARYGDGLNLAENLTGPGSFSPRYGLQFHPTMDGNSFSLGKNGLLRLAP